jgi:type I restriction enzyme S subunit
MTRWRELRVKHLADINSESLPENTDPGRDVRYVDISTVGRGSLVSEPELLTFGEAPSRARRLVREGDTIVSTVRTYLRAVLPIEQPELDLVVSTGFAVLRPRAAIHARYFAWAVQSDGFIEEVVSRSVGVSYPAINASEIGDIRVPMPPYERQRAIADYLDAETEHIDALIAKKQRLSTLIDERFRSRIRSLVKGGEPESGWWPPHQWAGPVPREWKPLKIGSAARLGSGTTPTSGSEKYYADDGVPWVTTSELRECMIAETERHVTPEAMRDFSALKVFPAGSVLVAMYGATVGRVGMLGIPAATNQACCAIFDGESLDPRFIYWWLIVNRTHLLDLAYGAGQPNISQETIRSLRIPAPGLDDQRAIAQKVDDLSNRVDAQFRVLGRQIELLRERRQALITAAVTGEIEIPVVAA